MVLSGLMVLVDTGTEVVVVAALPATVAIEQEQDKETGKMEEEVEEEDDEEAAEVALEITVALEVRVETEEVEAEEAEEGRVYEEKEGSILDSVSVV